MQLLPLLAVLAFAPADTVRVVLVATTDVHGYVTNWDYLQNTAWPGGLARAATVVDSLRQRYPGQVVLVDAGDALQGSPLAAYFGREVVRNPHPVIEAMNLLAYDAATPGDHDFDFGVDAFNRALGGATFPWVSGNLRTLPSDTLALPGYIVVIRNGVRVAIGGLTTPAAMVTSGNRLEDRLRVERLAPSLPGLVREMRQDADLVVILSHSGLDGPSSFDTTGTGAEQASSRLAEGDLRPDLVIVGHSHQELVDSVLGGVHFVQPRPEARSLAVVHVALVARNGALTPVRIRAERVLLEDVRPSARVMRRLADPHRTMLGWIPQTLGEADRRMSLGSARVEDTPLIRFVNEVQRRAARADLSATPVFDTRAGVDQGEITQGELFRLYPVEQTLRAVRISGAQLRAYLEQCARYFYADSTGRVATNRFVPAVHYDVLAGAQYTIDLSRPPGSRITRLEVRGRPVAPTDFFTLALGSSRQLGSGNFAMLAGAPVVYDKDEPIRGLIAAEIRRRHTLSGEVVAGADWSLAPAELAARARAVFVREGATAPEPPEPAMPPPLALPMKPNPRELARRDSILQEQDRRETSTRVVVATLRLPAEPGPGRGLARLLADAYRNALRADIAIVRQDEVGAVLPAGQVTASQIAEAAPESGRLLTLRLTGAELDEVLEHIVETRVPCCELAGVLVEFDPRADALERIRGVRLPNGKSIQGKHGYVIALSPRLLEGDSVFSLGATSCGRGKGCRVAGRLDRWQVQRSDRTAADVLVEYLRRLPQPATPPDDVRLVPTR